MQDLTEDDWSIKREEIRDEHKLDRAPNDLIVGWKAWIRDHWPNKGGLASRIEMLWKINVFFMENKKSQAQTWYRHVHILLDIDVHVCTYLYISERVKTHLYMVHTWYVISEL